MNTEKNSKPFVNPTKASHTFITILAIVSIIGFIGIISETLFSHSIGFYVEASLMIAIGIGFVLEGQITSLKKIRSEGLNPTNFTHLITVIIGIIALLAGIFSLPEIRIENQGFLAVKGIISFVAIIVIVIQTWIVK
jgi:nitrogen fixation/metabolism regulation signal transduction histidine kinase